MLQIRLSKDVSSENGGAPKPLPGETVTVACPDHLILADLPVAKSLGAVTSASIVRNVGRRSRRQLGERVHFCVRCDFPIAIYGRLSPCEHAFCLDCARSDSICYLCDERIQKIQTIKMMEGIIICAAPHCLKSFLKRPEFEAHIQDTHSTLLQPSSEKDEYNESEAKMSIASESTARAPSRSGFYQNTNSQSFDHRPREQSLSRPMLQPRPPGFDRPATNNFFNQQDAQQYNFPMPFPSNIGQNQPPHFNFPYFTPEGGQIQPFYNNASNDKTQPDSVSEQGSLLGFAPGMNFQGSWNTGPAPSFVGTPGNTGSAAFYQGGEYSMSVNPPLPPLSNKPIESFQDGNDGKSSGWQNANRDNFSSG